MLIEILWKSSQAVSSETTVKDCLVGNNSARAQVEGLVQESTVVNSEYDPAGTVHVILRMPLYGEFSRVMLSKIPEKKTIGQSTAEMLTAELSGASPVNRPSVAFTGLVIDVRGLKARQAMSPKILDENGNEIYGSKIAERDIALSKGMTGYTSDLAAARSHPRVTDDPLGVKGLKTEGSGAADIVVSNADAQAIRTADNLSFLKKCRVMIVLDEKE